MKALQQALIADLDRFRRYALSLTADVSHADDLVQSACEQALRGKAPARPEELAPWMFRVMRNRWIDEQRRSKRWSAEPLDDSTGDGLATAMAGPEEPIHLEQLLAALSRLAPPLRLTLTLISIEGLSYREAAEQMDVPIGTVMSRLSRARKALGRQLENGQ